MEQPTVSRVVVKSIINFSHFTEQDFVPITGTEITFPAGSSAGSQYCEQIIIINDGVREEVQEEFSVILNTTDSNVVLEPDTAQVLVVDNNSE